LVISFLFWGREEGLGELQEGLNNLCLISVNYAVPQSPVQVAIATKPTQNQKQKPNQTEKNIRTDPRTRNRSRHIISIANWKEERKREGVQGGSVEEHCQKNIRPAAYVIDGARC